MEAAQTFLLTRNESELHVVNELSRGRAYLSRGGWLVVTNSGYLYLVFSNQEAYKTAVKKSELTDKEKAFLLEFIKFLAEARKHHGQFDFSPEGYLTIFNNGLSLSIDGIDLVVGKMYQNRKNQIAAGLELINDILKEMAKDLTNDFMSYIKGPSKFFKKLNSIQFSDLIYDMLVFLGLSIPAKDRESDNIILQASLDDALRLYDSCFNLKKLTVT